MIHPTSSISRLITWTYWLISWTGMTDTPLTDDGVLEAKTAGKLIGNEEIKFDAVYTSLLRRSIKTVWMVLQEIGSLKNQKNVLLFLSCYCLRITTSCFLFFMIWLTMKSLRAIINLTSLYFSFISFPIYIFPFSFIEKTSYDLNNMFNILFMNNSGATSWHLFNDKSSMCVITSFLNNIIYTSRWH